MHVLTLPRTSSSSSFHFTSVVGGGGLSIEQLGSHSSLVCYPALWLGTAKLYAPTRKCWRALRTKERRDRDSARKTDAASIKNWLNKQGSHKIVVLICLPFRPRFCGICWQLIQKRKWDHRAPGSSGPNRENEVAMILAKRNDPWDWDWTAR